MCAPPARYSPAAGSLDARVNDGRTVRVFEGAVGDDVHLGVFLDGDAEVRLLDFRRAREGDH